MDITLRNLEYSDYHKGYIKLLQQLTICNNITFELFCSFVDQLNVNHKVIVHEKNNEILASGTIFIEQKIIRNYGKVGHIEDIIVDKTLRGNGVGQQIINELKKYAQKESCYKIILDCDKNVMNFYEKYGFTKKEEQMALYFLYQ
jgi:glucosamine-phosphate N-acetyltransferase